MTITYGLVLAGVVCLYLQLIFGYVCRWSTNWFPQVVGLAANNLASVINTIALGSMAEEHDAGVWILLLVVMNNSLITHDPENVMHDLLSLVNIGIIGYRAVRIVGHTGLQGVTCSVAKLFTIALVCVFALSKFLLAKGTSSKRASQEVADHMKKEHLHNGEYNASTLVGYRYLVSSTTTVEDIYKRDYGERAQGKDICLSFALFRLLFRRCQGFRCHEARVPKTAAFVLGNLLPPVTNDRYERGFAVVERELAFLHDHIHGGHVLWSPAHYFWYIALVVMNSLFMYTGSVLLSFTRREEHNMHEYVGNSIALLGSKGIFDLLLVIFHCNSNRWLVSHMCRCLPEDQTLHSRFDRFIAHLNMNKVLQGNYYWQNRIGQYSLLEEQASTLRQKIIDSTLSIFSRRNGSHRPRASTPVLLPSNLKTRISQVLRDSNGCILDLDGVPSLETDMQLPLEYSWQNERVADKIKVMFMWHIATSYCELMQSPPEGSVQSPPEGYEVATTLSRYCAYLLAFRPELLPGRTMDTKRIFCKVLDAVRVVEHPWLLPNLINRLNDWLQRYRVVATTEYEATTEYKGEYELIPKEIIANMTPDDGCVILTDGLNLGSLLMNCAISNNTERWRILENIWVKLVLSIAIQDAEHPNYAKPHEDCLAEGGEFLTHLWALLSHAGITEKQTWPPQQVYDLGQREQFIQKLRDNYL